MFWFRNPFLQFVFDRIADFLTSRGFGDSPFVRFLRGEGFERGEGRGRGRDRDGDGDGEDTQDTQPPAEEPEEETVPDTAADQPAVDDAAADEPAGDTPANEPVGDAGDEASVDVPADEPFAEEPQPDQPGADEAAADAPADEAPTDEAPADEATADAPADEAPAGELAGDAGDGGNGANPDATAPTGGSTEEPAEDMVFVDTGEEPAAEEDADAAVLEPVEPAGTEGDGEAADPVIPDEPVDGIEGSPLFGTDLFST